MNRFTRVHPTAALSAARGVSVAVRTLSVGFLAIGFATGCASRPTGTFDVAARSDVPREDYRVFYVPLNTEDRSKLSREEREELDGLDNLRAALVEELKDRGFQATTDASADDIDAYVHYGYSTQGERGVNYYHQPGQTFVSGGGSFTTPDWTTAIPYAREKQQIRVQLYDWSELVAAGGEFGRVRDAWRGSMETWISGIDGLMYDEARKMAMNLLADFPQPLPGAKPQREVYGLDERVAMNAARARQSQSEAGTRADETMTTARR
jgi:hypothetical protein